MVGNTRSRTAGFLAAFRAARASCRTGSTSTVRTPASVFDVRTVIFAPDRSTSRHVSAISSPIRSPANTSSDRSARRSTCLRSGGASFLVPSRVFTVHIAAQGGPGARLSANPCGVPLGGPAARVSGDVNVTPKQTLYVVVGGSGGIFSGGFGCGNRDYGSNGGFNGGAAGGGSKAGGGGGASDVRTSPMTAGLSPDTRLIVAGGGEKPVQTANSVLAASAVPAAVPAGKAPIRWRIRRTERRWHGRGRLW